MNNIKSYMYELKETIEEMPKKKKGMIITSVLGICLCGGGIMYAVNQPAPTNTPSIAMNEKDNKKENEKEETLSKELTDKVSLVTETTSEEEFALLTEEIQSSTLPEEEKQALLETLDKNYKPTPEVAVADEVTEESSEETTPEEKTEEVVVENTPQPTVEVTSTPTPQATTQASEPEVAYTPQPEYQPEPTPEVTPEPTPQPEVPQEPYRLEDLGNTGLEFATVDEAEAYLLDTMDKTFDAFERGEIDYVYNGNAFTVLWSDGHTTASVNLRKG